MATTGSGAGWPGSGDVGRGPDVASVGSSPPRRGRPGGMRNRMWRGSTSAARGQGAQSPVARRGATRHTNITHTAGADRCIAGSHTSMRCLCPCRCADARWFERVGLWIGLGPAVGAGPGVKGLFVLRNTGRDSSSFPSACAGARRNWCFPPPPVRWVGLGVPPTAIGRVPSLSDGCCPPGSRPHHQHRHRLSSPALHWLIALSGDGLCWSGPPYYPQFP